MAKIKTSSSSILGYDWKFAHNSRSKDAFSAEDIINTILNNRGIKSAGPKREFVNPKKPEDLKLSDFGVDKVNIKKAVLRIARSIKNKEKVIIYGDYDADGICSSAILWEILHNLGLDVTPHIPDRFSEGYGINPSSIKMLLSQHPALKLIITVDNGIVAREAVKFANNHKIDIIITDHHEKVGRVPSAHSIVHTKLTSGSGVAWLFAREISKHLKTELDKSALELVAIGTLADQLPLVGVNRSLVKYGLYELNKTKRAGVLSLLAESGVKQGEITVHTIGFVIAPRINAMGRLAQGLDSLRLLCTKSERQAAELAKLLGKTNQQRQKIVETAMLHAKSVAQDLQTTGFIVVWHDTYHEGVVGLVASKLTEEFGRPAIVFAKGEEISKASARSVPGINIFEVIQEMGSLLLTAGGHEMAAGLSVKTQNLEKFKEKLTKISTKYLDARIFKKTLLVDMEIDFKAITYKLNHALLALNPHGQGNPAPVFVSRAVEISDIKLVGRNSDHLKLKLMHNNKYFDAIGFGMGITTLSGLTKGSKVDVAYSIEENRWNGNFSLQLKLKDIII